MGRPKKDRPLTPDLKNRMIADLGAVSTDYTSAPTVPEIAKQLFDRIEAMRLGTDPSLNGQKLSFKEIANRLSKSFPVSKDALRKAMAAEARARQSGDFRRKPGAMLVAAKRRNKSADAITVPNEPIDQPDAASSDPARDAGVQSAATPNKNGDFKTESETKTRVLDEQDEAAFAKAFMPIFHTIK